MSDEELTVLAIASLQRGMDNGGFAQFLADGPAYVAVLPKALTSIGCTRAADITRRAFASTTVEGSLSLTDVLKMMDEPADKTRDRPARV